MEFSFEFAKRMIESADALFTNSRTKDDTGRAIIYLSSLSCEISLKALLEDTGYSIKELKKLSHKLDLLMNEVCTCYFKDSGIRATSIRSKEVVPNTANGTIGTLLESQASGASIYPHEIRYGEKITHFPPEVMLDCAKEVSLWCTKNIGNLVRNYKTIE